MYEKKLERNTFGRTPVPVARMKNPNIPGIGYSNASFLYDSFSVAVATAMPATTSMFQVPIGSGGKTKAQTNMKQAGVLDNGDVFKLHAISVVMAFNTCLADAANILQNCALRLIVGGREFTLGPVMSFPGGRGGCVGSVAQVGTALAGNNIQGGVTNGVPDIRAMFTFQDPIEIQANEQITAELTTETAFSTAAAAAGGTGTTLYVYLDGIRTRKVA